MTVTCPVTDSSTLRLHRIMSALLKLKATPLKVKQHRGTTLGVKIPLEKKIEKYQKVMNGNPG